MTTTPAPRPRPETAFGELDRLRRELWHMEDLAEDRSLTDAERSIWSHLLDRVIFLEDELEERSSCH